MKNKIKTKRGFSLVELMVATSMFLLLISVMIVNQKKFGDNIVLTNSATDVALGVRQAQVLGSNSKADITGTNFTYSYGVHVTESRPNSYIIFADKNNNNYYDINGDDGLKCLPNTECISFNKFPLGNKITDFCTTSRCITTSGTSAIDGADVLFRSQTLEPVIKPFNEVTGWSDSKWQCTPLGDGTGRLSCTQCSSGAGCAYVNPGEITGTFNTGSVTLSSAQNFKKTVDITNVGQVSVREGTNSGKEILNGMCMTVQDQYWITGGTYLTPGTYKGNGNNYNFSGITISNPGIPSPWITYPSSWIYYITVGSTGGSLNATTYPEWRDPSTLVNQLYVGRLWFDANREIIQTESANTQCPNYYITPINEIVSGACFVAQDANNFTVTSGKIMYKGVEENFNGAGPLNSGNFSFSIPDPGYYSRYSVTVNRQSSGWWMPSQSTQTGGCGSSCPPPFYPTPYGPNPTGFELGEVKFYDDGRLKQLIPKNPQCSVIDL